MHCYYFNVSHVFFCVTDFILDVFPFCMLIIIKPPAAREAHQVAYLMKNVRLFVLLLLFPAVHD